MPTSKALNLCSVANKSDCGCTGPLPSVNVLTLSVEQSVPGKGHLYSSTLLKLKDSFSKMMWGKIVT